jgi:hypothetical protein
MPLTITVQPRATFKVGDLVVEIHEVHSSSDFTVKANGKLFDVNEDKWTTIADGVELRAPHPSQDRQHRSRLRVQIEAPNFFVTRERG